ncbi:MAG: hypothetical protein ACRDKG_00920, partial [Actinomycetota bacterium]
SITTAAASRFRSRGLLGLLERSGMGGDYHGRVMRKAVRYVRAHPVKAFLIDVAMFAVGIVLGGPAALGFDGPTVVVGVLLVYTSLAFFVFLAVVAILSLRQSDGPENPG